MHLPNAPILVIGRAGLDLYADPPGTRIADAGGFVSALGGSAGNIAAGLARQGAAVGLLGCVGDDDVGRFVEAQLDGYGIDRRHVRAVGGTARTTLAVVETRMQMGRVLYRSNAADLRMDRSDIAAVDWAAWGSVVTTGTVLAAQPARDATIDALKSAKEAGLVRVLDIDWRPESWPSLAEAEDITREAAGLCDIVIGNDEEFTVLAGSYDGGLDAARDLVAEGAQLVIYKMGERGAVTITPEGETRTGIWPVHALKPVGAGDGFMAGLLAALIQGHPLAEAVSRGAATAAIVVSTVGCAPAMPTTGALETFMGTHPGLTEI